MFHSKTFKMKIRKAKLKDIVEITNLLEILFTQEVEFEFQKELHIKALKKIIKNKNMDIYISIKRDNTHMLKYK